MIKINKVVKVGLVLTLFCFFSLLTSKTKAEDFGIYEGKEIILTSGGEKFTVKMMSPGLYLNVEGIGDITLGGNIPYGGWCGFPGNLIEETKLIIDKDDEKMIYLKGKFYSWSKKKVAEPFYMEMNLSIKKGFPCLFINQRIVNTTDKPQKFSFSSYRVFQNYVIDGEDMKVQQTPKQWAVVGVKNWIWLHQEDKERGLGVISLNPTKFRSSPQMTIYWGIVEKKAEEGNSVGCQVILTTAKTPQEVKALYEKIKGMKLNPFLSPKEGSLVKNIPALLKKTVSAKVNAQPNKLIIDLIKLAPYARWRGYFGELKFGHFQEKTQCVLYRKKVVDGKIQPHSLMMSYMESGYVRGKYNLILPKAEKLTFDSSISGGGRGWVGYYKKGVGTKYLLEEIHPRKKKISCDMTTLVNQELDIILKVEEGGRTGGTFFHWDKAQIVAFYPDKGKPDLALSTSDISLIPQPDGKIVISTEIHNIGKRDADKFAVNIYDGEYLLKKQTFSSLLSGDVCHFSSLPVEMKEGKHKIMVKIETVQEENSKDNNETVLMFNAPIWGIGIINIEPKPFPYQTEYLKVNLDNRLSSIEGYELRCVLYDYFGKKVKSIKRNLSGENSLQIRPFPEKRIGWWKAEVSLLHKGKEVDKLSGNFCYTPEPRPLKDSIFDICAYFGTGQLKMIKYTGASGVLFPYYIREKYRNVFFEQGQFPYFTSIAPRSFGCKYPPKEKDKFSKYLSCLKETAYQIASEYKGKGIWWMVLGECNGHISPSRYARIVKAFYEGAKKGAPDCKIATAGLGGCPSLLDSGKKGTKYEWTKEMYPQARGYFDAISNHGYSHCLPEEPFYNREIKPYIDLIEKYGDLGKVEFHNNEWAPWTGGTWSARIVRAYLYELGKKEKGARMAYFNTMDYTEPHCKGRHGLCKFNLNPRPEYQAYAVMAHNLTGAEFIEEKDIGEKNYFYIFKRDKKEFVCTWKQGGEKDVLILPAKRKVKITDLMGEENEIKPDKGNVKVVISTNPIYVEGLNLRDFKLISKYPYSKEVNFEDKFPKAKELKESGDFKDKIFYNMALLKWKRGEKGVKELIERKLAVSTISLPDEETIKAKYTTIPITLDGEISEWEDGNWYVISSSTGKRYGSRRKEYKGDDDLSYNFSTKWDKDNLYFAIKVKDDRVIDDHPGAEIAAWGGDCIELYLDVLGLRRHYAERGLEFTLYFFGLNDKKYVMGDVGLGKDTKAMFKWKKTKDGYTMEIAIPLEEIFLNGLKEGHQMAFNIGIDDADTNSGAPDVKYQMCWGEVKMIHTCVNAGDLVFIR